MGFDDQFERSQDALHRQCSDVLTYVPDPEGNGELSNPVEIINAITGVEVESDEPDDRSPSGFRKVRRLPVSIITDEKREGFCGVKTPEKTATVWLGDWEYSIESLGRQSSGSTDLMLIRETLRAAHRGGYRK